MSKASLIFLLLFCFCIISNGQRLADMTNIPATPQTSSLFKTISAPVSYYTGQPDVSIPIYTISQDGVAVPVKISFNTSGIFVNEEATSVGLGVKLDWGGSIVRSANGRPDERELFYGDYNGTINKIEELKQELPKDYSNLSGDFPPACYPYCGNLSSLETYKQRLDEYHCINLYNDPYKDGQGSWETDLRPDDFFYNFLDKSGKFKFNQHEKKFVTFPLDDIKIEKEFTPSGISKFTITKSDGVKILFGDDAIEATNKNSPILLCQSWFIKKVTTVKNSTIDFSYIENVFSKRTELNEEVRFPTYGGAYGSGGYDGVTMHEKMIKKISFEEGYLDFDYTFNRIDLNSSNGPGAPQLNKITLYDYNGNIIKIYKFYYSYFTANNSPSTINSRLKLDAFAIADKNSNDIVTYRFEYNTNAGIPSKESLARDHWGYFNNAPNNTTRIPSTLVPLVANGAMTFQPFNFSWRANIDRYINTEASKTFTIKKITFPTGGERTYNFESNEVRWYELFDKMKDISNDGYDLFSNQLIIRGVKMSDCFPVPNEVNNNQTVRTLYGDEFTIDDFNDVVLGDPSLYIETTFMHPELTSTQINGWLYNIDVKIQKKNGSTFTDYAGLATNDWNSYHTGSINNTTANTTLKSKLLNLPNGLYRLRVIMTNPPPYVSDNWTDSHGNSVNTSHNTTIKLFWRKKNYKNIRVGGLRVKSIIDKEGSNEYQITYDYTTPDGYCSGHMINLPEYKEDIYTMAPNGYPYSGTRINSEAVFPLTKTQGSNVGYTNVIKKDIGKDTIREEFTYSFKASSNSGYMKEYYSEAEPRSWQSGKLLSDRKYKDNVLISKDTFDYYGLNNETNKGFTEEINTSLIKGSLYSAYGEFSDDAWDIETDRRPYTLNQASYIIRLYYFDNMSYFQPDTHTTAAMPPPPGKIPYFRTYTGFDKLKSKTTNYYSGSNILMQTENYYYDAQPTNINLTKTEITNSASATLSTKFYYPQDILAEDFMQQLVDAYRIGNPVKTERYKNNTKLSEEKFSYSQDASTSNLILPKYVYTSLYPSLQLEKKVIYDLFNSNGDLLQYHQLDAYINTLIWDYNNTHPIAEVKNANQSQIAYTSFEADGTGNWAFNSTGISTSAGFTGAKCYTLSSTNTLTKTGLTSGNYIVTYWKKNGVTGTVSINSGSAGISLIAKRGWTLYSRILNNVSSVTISGTGGVIDELRLYPTGAQMITYTYAPLIGMTSQCDAANHVTMYEYDGLSRLSLIRDQDNNIIKKMDYHYNGQPETSPACSCDDPIHGKRCINDQCQQGVRVNTSTVKQSNGTFKCVYHWEWPNFSGIANSANITEYNTDPCFID